MILDIEQIACALELPRGKIERWIRQGRIPLVRRDNTCTFDRQALEQWASRHNLAFNPDKEKQEECVIAEETGLIAAFSHGGVYDDIPGSSTVEVFQAAVDRMDFIPDSDKPHLVQKLLDREALTSTGIGKGIAIPHPREPESLGLSLPAVAACFLSDPIDFQALDGRPVSILFILLSPSVRIHLQILSKMSFCLRQDAFITFLQQRPDVDALIDRLEEMDVQSDKEKPPS